MKHLKIYEGYLSDKMKVIKDKFNKLKKIVDFIEKFELKYFNINIESNDYFFNYIKKDTNGDYFLDYEIIKTSESARHYIVDLPINVIDDLITNCEQESIFEIQTQLEIGIGDIDTFIKILKTEKNHIKFNTDMFSELIENELQDDANSFKFQDILFSTHPEAFTSFMDECIDGQKRSKKHNFVPLKIAFGIRKKYGKLFNDYKILKNSEKYNL
jgi:hypothetical protein